MVREPAASASYVYEMVYLRGRGAVAREKSSSGSTLAISFGELDRKNCTNSWTKPNRYQVTAIDYASRRTYIFVT